MVLFFLKLSMGFRDWKMSPTPSVHKVSKKIFFFYIFDDESLLTHSVHLHLK